MRAALHLLAENSTITQSRKRSLREKHAIVSNGSALILRRITHAPRIPTESKPLTASTRMANTTRVSIQFPKRARPGYEIGNFAVAACAAMLLHALKSRQNRLLWKKWRFPPQQVTGVTVSAKGWVFVNFPSLIG